jgi:hypothetical protein
MEQISTDFLAADQQPVTSNPLFDPHMKKDEEKKVLTSLHPPPPPDVPSYFRMNRDRLNAMRQAVQTFNKTREEVGQTFYLEPPKRKINDILAPDSDNEDDETQPLLKPALARRTIVPKILNNDACAQTIIAGVERGTKFKFAIDLSTIKDLHEPSYQVIRAWLNLECLYDVFPRDEFTQRRIKKESTGKSYRPAAKGKDEVVNYIANIIALIEKYKPYEFPQHVHAFIPHALCTDEGIDELTTIWYKDETSKLKLSDSQATEVSKQLPPAKHFISTVIPQHLNKLTALETPKAIKKRVYSDQTLEEQILRY